MEYVIGPVVALLIGLKYSHYTGKKNEEAIKAFKNSCNTTTAAVIDLTERVD